MADQPKDFFQDFRERMKKWSESEGKSNQWADFLMSAPDLLLLLCKLSIDKGVPEKEKAKLAGAMAYFISPVDLVPEAIVGPVGYVDDIALAAYVLNSVVNNSDPAIVKKHWAGDVDILDLIQQILKVAEEMVGSGLWKRLKGLFY